MASPTDCRDATTTKCFVPSFISLNMSMLGPTVRPVISTGTRMVMIRKVLLRTRSKYSRRAMRKMLCIRLAYRFDEDFFERGFHQFELADSRSLRHQPQQLLGIGA